MPVEALPMPALQPWQLLHKLLLEAFLPPLTASGLTTGLSVTRLP